MATPTTFTLSSCLPGSIHRRQDVDHIKVSPGDTLAALKAKICNAMGLPPASVPKGVSIPPASLTTAELWRIRRVLATVSLDDSRYVVKHLDVRVGVEGWCHTAQNNGSIRLTVVQDYPHESTVFVKALPAGGIELFRYAPEREQEITAEYATMRSTLRLGPRTRLVVKLEPPREIPRYSRVMVNGRIFQLSPEKSVGDLQALCATALGVPVKSQALLALNRPVSDEACSLGQLKRLLDQSCDGEIKLLDLRDPAQARDAGLAGVEHISVFTLYGFGKPVVFKVVPSDSIKNVKARIPRWRMTGDQANDQERGLFLWRRVRLPGGQFVCQKKELEDGHTLSDYNIQWDSKLIAMLKEKKEKKKAIKKTIKKKKDVISKMEEGCVIRRVVRTRHNADEGGAVEFEAPPPIP